MTKLELAKTIAAHAGTTPAAALHHLEYTMSALGAAFRAGERVELRGFGTFTPRITKERAGRNPKTGAPAVITARLVVKFKLSA